MIDYLNSHFKKTFSDFLVETLRAFGHRDVYTKWREDGAVTVTCDGGGVKIPAQLFRRRALGQGRDPTGTETSGARLIGPGEVHDKGYYHSHYGRGRGRTPRQSRGGPWDPVL